MGFSREQWDAMLTTGGGYLAPDSALAEDMVGQQLGAFEVVELIAAGGMASVYLAQRHHPFEQQVAIKVLSAGLRDSTHQQHFLRERQILADLEHPNIARILDGGLTDDGRPYLVMEYVSGEPLGRYLQAQKPNWRQRLHLLLGVIDAVAAAHQRLVVHRDLKPGNIIVSPDGVPKLLDFGIADAASQASNTDGERLFTPLYAAPEQLTDAPVQAATDIYQIGLLIALCLTSRHPFADYRDDFEALRGAILTGLSPLSLTPATDLRLPRRLWRDLNAIIDRCVQVDAAQRYETVADLRRDLLACLEGRAVAARGGAWRYRAAKFVHQHRYALTSVAVSVVLIALLSLWYWVRLVEEIERADHADAVSAFVVSLLDEADPLAGAERDSSDLITVSGFEPGAIKDAPPRLQRELIERSGRTLLHLGRFEQVIALVKPLVDELAEEALPPPRYADYLSLLGYAQYRNGDALGGRAHLRLALELQQGADQMPVPLALTLQRLGLVERSLGQADDALALIEQALALLSGAGEGLDQLATARAHRGMVLTDLGRFDEASKDLETAIAQYNEADNPIRAGMNLVNLSDVKRLMGRAAEAQQHAENAVQVALDQRQKNPQLLASALISRGNAVLAQQQWSRAITDYRQAYEIYRAQLGRDHPKVGGVSYNLATAWRLSGRCDLALAHYDEALRIARSHYSEDHTSVDNPRRQRLLCQP